MRPRAARGHESPYGMGVLPCRGRYLGPDIHTPISLHGTRRRKEVGREGRKRAAVSPFGGLRLGG